MLIFWAKTKKPHCQIEFLNSLLRKELLKPVLIESTETVLLMSTRSGITYNQSKEIDSHKDDRAALCMSLLPGE